MHKTTTTSGDQFIFSNKCDGIKYFLQESGIRDPFQYHYDDVIMGTIASQITSLTIVYSTVYSGADQRKHQSSASLALGGEFTGAGEFPAQMASNAENVSISWRHYAKNSFSIWYSYHKNKRFIIRSRPNSGTRDLCFYHSFHFEVDKFLSSSATDGACQISQRYDSSSTAERILCTYGIC